MSLATRVTALAQAIGADIKALKLGQSVFQIGGWSPGQNLAAGWNTLDLYQQYAQISPAGAFTLGPNYVTINQDGWYSISAGAVINGGNVYTVSLGTAPATEGYISESSGNVAGGSITVTASAVFLPAGTKVYVTVWAQTATSGGVRYFSISRAGGPKGDKGDKGDAGGVNAVDTTNWNTATATNFYRGVPPEFKSGADNGPGDTLNPPTTAGFVFTSSDGSIVQRVWDLSTNLGYTRIYKSGAWGSWVKDLSNPRFLTEQAVGLPNPVEGEERYFQNAAMKTLGILWKFRYDATAPSGKPKWTFAGGMPYYKKVAASVPANAGASSPWTDLNFMLPLGGDYMVEIGARLYNNSAPYTGNASAYLQHIRNNVVQANYATIDNWTVQSGGQAFSDTVSLMQTDRIDGALSNDVVQGLTGAAGANAMAESRWIRITPIRVTM